MTYVECTHLGSPPAAGGRNREAHLVVDIHEGQGPGCMGTRTRHVGAARPERGELVPDPATGLERQPGFVNLLQDLMHRVFDGP